MRHSSPKRRSGRLTGRPRAATTALALATAAIALGALAPCTARAQDPLKVVLPDGRALAVSCRGAGSPAVVIDAGLGTAGIGSAWEPITTRIASVTRVCLYDRAGLGRSEAAREIGRTSSDVVADLRLALPLVGEWGPYVLVGHSVGGVNMLVFAGRHPEVVAGLVLVDSSHPDQTATWRAALPPQTPDEERGIAEARRYLDALEANPTANPERLDLNRVGNEARAVTAVDGPLIVLTHSPRWRMAAGMPEPLAERLEAASQGLQGSFLDLSPDADQLVSENGGHNLPLEDPDLVTRGILLAVAKARSGNPDSLVLASGEPRQAMLAAEPYPLTQQLRTADFSGVVLVKDRGRVLFRGAFGLADRSFDAPVTLQTRFPIASITKLVTAAAILRLVEEGRLSLDEAFGRHLPDVALPGGDRITVRQLLGHMSGLPQFDTVTSFEQALANGLPQYQLPRTPRQLLELCCSSTPSAEPGARFDYNNADYIVLGQLIEAVTGETYAEAVERLVLRPAGATHSAMMQWDRLVPQLARTYYRHPGRTDLSPDLPLFWENSYAAGGLYSTLDDIDALSDALFGGRLLSPSSVAALLTPAGDDYGLGLWSYGFTRKGVAYRVAKRPGSIMGANAVLYRLLDRDISIIVLANSNAADLDQLAQDLAEAVLDGRPPV